VPLEHRAEGRLFAVAGASRSGKTLWTAQRVARVRRVLVWDLLGEWSTRYRCARVESFTELAARIDTRARLAFHRPGMAAPSRDGKPSDFETFCRLAFCWLRLAPGALVIEETASVTHAGKAPAAWGDVVRMSLRYGVELYALTQRPAESDKTAFGNASVVHAGRFTMPRDRATIADYLDVPVATVAALRPLDWIERDHVTGVTRTGRVNPRART
jgi:hypothetical protein